MRKAGERTRTAEIGEVAKREGDIIYSLSKSKEQSLKENLRKLGEKRIKKETDSKTITILTDEFTVNKNIYSSKGRSSNEVNARIKHIPMFDQLIKQSTFGGTDTEIRGVEKEAKKGVVAMHKFVTTVDGYSVEMLVRDKGDKQYLYEVKFIKTKKIPNRAWQTNLPSRLTKEMLRTVRLYHKSKNLSIGNTHFPKKLPTPPTFPLLNAATWRRRRGWWTRKAPDTRP